jgi:formylglycine-generating enzyme required for sulfatase activity
MLVAILAVQLTLQVSAQNGTITGQVIGLDGKPASGLRVAVALADRDGRVSSDQLISITKTDESGHYRLNEVAPGRYGILAGPVTSPTYYPGTLDVAGAKIVAIGQGSRTAGLDFALVPPPGFKVTQMTFVAVSPGEFVMGCSTGDRQCAGDEKPAHRVVITKGFEIGRTEVTQEEWQTVTNTAPPAVSFRGMNIPVLASWNQAKEFLDRLNARGDGFRYRLPTEAEWEYAARAGSKGPFIDASLDAVAWYSDNTPSQNGRTPGPVGQKNPNAWGLYDVLGNQSEWVQDWYAPDYFERSPVTDPAGPPTGTERVLRGGSVFNNAATSRVSFRFGKNPDDKGGFRVVRQAL